MIQTSLSPNLERDDLWLTLKSLFQPWSWRNEQDVKYLEEEFKKKYSLPFAISFQRGRDGLLVLLQALGIGSGDEVILQAYTCLVVPNAVSFAGALPVYADVEEKGFNIDPESIRSRINPRTKAVIVQHTFGIPAQLREIQKICSEKHLFLIEDCAHGLSGSFQGKPLGSFGIAAFYSFGRDKIISSVWGGMVSTSEKVLAEKIAALRGGLPLPSFFQICQALLHPIITSIMKPFYGLRVGRLLVKFFQYLRILPLVIFPSEKKAQKPVFMPQRIPGALALLARHQLGKLDRFHEHRKEIVHQYQKALAELPIGLPQTGNDIDPSWLRYPLLSAKAPGILKQARNEGLFLGDWYATVLAPPCNLKDFQYEIGSCPRAEKAAQETFNLPTHIQIGSKDVQKIVKFLRENLTKV